MAEGGGWQQAAQQGTHVHYKLTKIRWEQAEKSPACYKQLTCDTVVTEQ